MSRLHGRRRLLLFFIVLFLGVFSVGIVLRWFTFPEKGSF